MRGPGSGDGAFRGDSTPGSPVGGGIEDPSPKPGPEQARPRLLPRRALARGPIRANIEVPGHHQGARQRRVVRAPRPPGPTMSVRQRCEHRLDSRKPDPIPQRVGQRRVPAVGWALDVKASGCSSSTLIAPGPDLVDSPGSHVTMVYRLDESAGATTPSTTREDPREGSENDSHEPDGTSEDGVLATLKMLVECGR